MTESNYEKTHNISRLAIIIAVVSGVLIGVMKNNPIIALISVVFGMILLIGIQRKYKVALTDERIQQISLKAGDRTFRVFTVGFALLFFANYYYPFIKPLTSECRQYVCIHLRYYDDMQSGLLCILQEQNVRNSK